MTRRSLFTIGIVAVLILAGIGVWYWRTGPSQKIYSGPAEAITLAAYAGDTAAPVWIAEELGYFRDHDLDVTIKEFSAGKLAADPAARVLSELVPRPQCDRGHRPPCSAMLDVQRQWQGAVRPPPNSEAFGHT